MHVNYCGSESESPISLDRGRIPPGTITVLRRFGFLLILAMTFAQVHLCEPSYRFADGKICQTCPSLTDHSVEALQADLSTIEPVHGDCHDCCDLLSCEDHDQTPQVGRTVGSSLEFEVCIASTFEFKISKLGVPRSVFVHVESTPSTGPPGTNPSRAPPAPQLT